MPETTIDEYGDANPWKHDVGPHLVLADLQAMVDAIAQSTSVEQPPQR